MLFSKLLVMFPVQMTIACGWGRLWKDVKDVKQGTKPQATSIYGALHMLQKEPLSRKISQRGPFFPAHEALSQGP